MERTKNHEKNLKNTLSCNNVFYLSLWIRSKDRSKGRKTNAISTSYGIATCTLNLRKDTTKDSESICTINNGECVIILESYTNGWAKVNYIDALIGYVDMEYLEPITYEDYSMLPKVVSYIPAETVTKNKIAEYSTNYDASNTNRVNNITIASEAIRVMLEPGAIFNWYSVVGEATKEKGYLKAGTFVGGKLSESYGGGVCQVTSTLHAAISQTDGFKILQRKFHSSSVSYITRDLEATVAYPYLNFVFQNTRETPIIIETDNSNGTLTIYIYELLE